MALHVNSQSRRPIKALCREEMLGALIVKKACEAPVRQIISNAGRDSSLVLERS